MNRNGHPLKCWPILWTAKLQDVRMTRPSLFSNPTESLPGTWLLPYAYWLWRVKRAWAESCLFGLIPETGTWNTRVAQTPLGSRITPLPVDTLHPPEKH